MASEGERNPGAEVDLDEVAKLIDSLERDLAAVRTGSSDVQRLRDEVETLKNVLNSPVRRHHWVRDALHDIREAVVAEGIKGGQYVAEIGRILGL